MATLIAVVGGNEASPENLHLAEEVGRELARRGVVLLCGGFGGVMEAACRGAKQEDGTTVGILPGDDASNVNPYVDIPICTGMSYARNVIIVKSAGAVIAVDGAYGTLSEIAHALGEDIPVIGLNTWTLIREEQEDRGIVRAENAVDAVEMALAAAAKRW
jgi:uncharacterized protein (TIGR00725 family)